MKKKLAFMHDMYRSIPEEVGHDIICVCPNGFPDT